MDSPSLDSAIDIAQPLAKLVGMFKINIHLFTSAGPAAIRKIRELGPEIFLDLKFHDIPNTVSGAVSAAAGLQGVRLLNVHALGGLAMMRAAAEAGNSSKVPKAQRPALLAVTILTSMDNDALKEVGIAGPVSRRVVKLGKLAREAGLDGVVASPQEVAAIRKACGKGFLIVVPGVRPRINENREGTTKAKQDDQARVATPAQAIRDGADYLVIGRPITAAPDPESAARAILDEIASELS